MKKMNISHVSPNNIMKKIEKFVHWVYNLFQRNMNPRTVNEIIRDLDAIDGAGTWQVIDGVQSLTTVNRQPPNSVAFAIGSGLLIKSFLNRRTGEIKLFPAKMFGYPDQDI